MTRKMDNVLVNRSQAGLNMATVAPIADRHAVETVSSSAVKPDSKDALLSRLAEYNSLPDDWDGYGGKAASLAAVKDSVYFLTRFP